MLCVNKILDDEENMTLKLIINNFMLRYILFESINFTLVFTLLSSNCVSQKCLKYLLACLKSKFKVSHWSVRNSYSYSNHANISPIGPVEKSRRDEQRLVFRVRSLVWDACYRLIWRVSRQLSGDVT